MAFVEIQWHPSRKDLRIFGFALAVFCAGIALLCYRSDREFNAAETILSGLALLSIGVGVFAPQWLCWVYRVLMVIAFPIGWVVSHVLFGAVFYLVFTPIGLLMRLFGRDPMQRRFDPDANTYWVPHKPREFREDYFRQF